LLASYFWLKQMHMIHLYRHVREMVKDDEEKSTNEQDCFAATLDNGHRVFFWKDDLVGSGNAAGNAGRLAGSAP
jgi:hypothetical protein